MACRRQTAIGFGVERAVLYFMSSCQLSISTIDNTASAMGPQEQAIANAEAALELGDYPAREGSEQSIDHSEWYQSEGTDGYQPGEGGSAAMEHMGEPFGTCWY